MDKILSWKIGGKNKVMEIENILEKSWNFSTGYHESRTRSSDNSISIGLLHSDLAMGAFGLCCNLQIVMIFRRQTIFSTPYFQFEIKSDFLFVFVMNVHDDLLCLSPWHHGKQWKLSWRRHGILLSDFCGNPVHVLTCTHWPDLVKIKEEHLRWQ